MGHIVPNWSSARGFVRRCLARPLQNYQRLDAIDEAMDPNSQYDASAGKPAVDTFENVAAGHAGGSHQHHAAHRDKAADFLDSATVPITVTAADNKRILRKLDLVILPILLWVYFLQYLDKATLSYASVFGLISDTNLQGEDYSWLGSILYIAQMVMQPVVAFFLVKFPIGKFTGVVVLGWGAVLCFMAVAHDFSGLMATRFFLGAFEASVGEYCTQSRYKNAQWH
jgi:Major Facilitator Superfamily